MSEVFRAILNMSLTASFVIVAVIVARLLLRRAPKVFSYALWAVVLFNLLCPIKFEAPVSLNPIHSETISADIVNEVVEISPLGSAYGVLSTILTDGYQPVNTESYVSDTDGRVWTTADVSDDEMLFRFMSYLWPVGVAAMVLYAVVSYALLRHRLRFATRREENIYETDRIRSPFVLGFIHPAIYLSVGLSDNDLGYILRHERTHIKRRDYLIKPLAFFALALHWFNPLVWLAYFLMDKDMEMSCDERVLKEMGGEIKETYSNALLSLATGKRLVGLSPLAFGEGGTKARIKNILNFKKPPRIIIAAAIALVAALTVGLAVNRADNTPYDPVPEIFASRYQYMAAEAEFLKFDFEWDGGEADGIPVWKGDYTEGNALTVAPGVTIGVTCPVNRDVALVSGSLYLPDGTSAAENRAFAENGGIFVQAPTETGEYICELTLEYANPRLEATYGLKIVVSEMIGIDFSALSALRTPYVGDNSAVGKIVDVLPPLGDELTQQFFSIGDDYGTGLAPYTLTLYYKQDGMERNITVMPKNAALLFALIDNLEEVNFAFRNTPSGGELDKAAYTSRIAVNKEQIGDFIGSLDLTWENFQNDFAMAATLVFAQSEPVGATGENGVAFTTDESTPRLALLGISTDGTKMSLNDRAVDKVVVEHTQFGQTTRNELRNGDEVRALAKWLYALKLERKEFSAGQFPGDRDGGEFWSFNVNGIDGINGLFGYGDYGNGECYALYNGERYYAQNPSDPPIPELELFVPTWAPLKDLPLDYGKDAAIADGIYVNIHGSEIYNQKMIDMFYESVFSEKSAISRTMEYTVEGDPIITDYWFDGDSFTVTTDSRRDKFGAQEIIAREYLYLVPLDRSRPAGTPTPYFLSNEQNIFTGTGDGGATLIDDLALIPSPSDSVTMP